MADDDKGLTREDVSALFKELLAEQAPKGGGAKGAGGGDVTSQVEAAVAKVRAGDAEAAERKTLADRITALENKKPAEPEKQPKSYRRITSLLWGNDDDE